MVCGGEDKIPEGNPLIERSVDRLQAQETHMKTSYSVSLSSEQGVSVASGINTFNFRI